MIARTRTRAPAGCTGIVSPGRSRRIAVRGLDSGVEYAVLKGVNGENIAKMTGRELEENGFEAVLPERCDGELYEIVRADARGGM